MQTSFLSKTLAVLAAGFLSAELASAQIVWNGASGVDNKWSTAGNWIGGVVPGLADNVKFFDDGADPTVGNINNVVNAGFSGTVASLQYGQTNGFHTTQIEAGKTVTVLGSLIVGTEAEAAQNLDAAITGPGVLVVSNTAVDMIIRQGGNGTSRRATLDLSGLDTFVAEVDQIVIGRADPPGLANINRNTGYLYLAKTNRIRSASTSATSSAIGIEVGRSGSNNGSGSRLYLGQTNAIFAASLSVGMEKETGCQMLFNSTLFTDSVAYFRGSDGTSRVSLWAIGDGEANSGTTSCQGTCDFTGGTVDALVGSMTLGRASANASGTGNSRGTLTMTAGIINVNTLQAGLQTLSTGKNGNGTLNINGGTLVVNDLLDLGHATGGAGVATTVGTLNINSGTVLANAIATGPVSGGSTINITTGTLVLTNTAGATDAALGTVSLSDAVLRLAMIGGAPRVVVTNLTTGGAGNTISVGALPAITSYPVTFSLIKYQDVIGGAGYNFTLTGVPAAFNASLVDNAAGRSVDLVIHSGPIAQAVAWAGAANADWDTTTKNWRVGSMLTNFFDNDFVTFDDSAVGATTINLTTTLQPGSVTINNSSTAYVLGGSGSIAGLGGLTKLGSGTLLIKNSGANSYLGDTIINGGTLQVGDGGASGSLGVGVINNNASLVFNRGDAMSVGSSISGSGSLTKNGAGVLTLNGANTFDGALTIGQGTLKAGNNSALGSTNGTTIINSGATLDVGANAINLGLEQFIVSGSGVGGQGAIINSSGSGTFVGPNVAFVTMAGDTTFGGTGRWDLRSSTTANPAFAALSTGGNPYTLTKVGPNGVYLPGVTVDPALGDVDIQEGTLAIESGTTGLGDPAKTLTVRAGAMLQVYNMTNLLNKQIVLNGSGTNITVNNASGACIIVGPMTLHGDCTFNAGGTSLTLSNTLAGTGSLIKIGGAALALAGSPAAYTGNTTVSNGTLVVNTSLNGGGTLTTMAGTTLAGNGNSVGPVVVNGAVQPGGVAAAGTFTCSSLTLETGATLTVDLRAVNTIGGGVNDLIQVNGNLTANGNAITINLLQGNLQAGTYRLLAYTGTLNGSFNPTVSVAGGASRFGFTLDTSTAGQVNLIVSGSAAKLRWGSNASSIWDIATTANWFNLGTSAADTFYQADSVLLDDTAGVITGIEIPAGVSVVPTVITNRSEGNYFAISGAGKISGGASIVKQGTSVLTLGSTNDFTGTVTVEAGTLQVTNNAALGSVDGATIIKSGATLDVGNPVVAANAVNLGLEPITVSGPGVSDGGAIVNSTSLAQQNAVRVVTLAGHTSFGGAARWDIRGTGAALSTGGNAFNLTKVGANQVSLVGVAVDPALADIDVQGGIFSLETSTTSAGNPARTLTVRSGATLQLYQLAVALDKVIALNGDGVTITFNNNNGVNVVAGPVTLAGDCVFSVGGTSLTLNNAVGGSGSLVKNGTSLMTLAGVNNYAGATLVNGGTLALVGAGAIVNSPTLTLASATTLDASGRADGKLTLGNGQTLLGHGTVRGSLLVNAGATVSPGNDAEGISLSALTVTGSLVLAGTNAMQTDKLSQTNDVIGGAASITFGGRLRITDLYSTAFADGDSFKLFDGASYSGAFAAIEPATPGAGLYWDTRQLTVSGTLKVVSTPPPLSPPSIANIIRTGNDIIISGAGGAPGATYNVLSSTNLTLPRSSWTPTTTRTFLSDGSFIFTNTVDPSAPLRFYLIQLP